MVRATRMGRRGVDERVGLIQTDLACEQSVWGAGSARVAPAASRPDTREWLQTTRRRARTYREIAVIMLGPSR